MKCTSFLAILVTVITAGCGTLVGGTVQEIGLFSEPAGAEVSVDGIAIGRTPLVAKLKRGSDHAVRFESPGYLPYEVKVRKEVRGWVVPEAMFYLVPVVFDAVVGGLYALTPAHISVHLYADRSGLAVEQERP